MQISCIVNVFAYADCWFSDVVAHMSRVMRKPDFCLCENKGADQLRSNCEADQRLCFRYTDSTLSLLIKSEISSFYAASGTVHVGLCQTWLETPKTGFLASRLILYCKHHNKSDCKPIKVSIWPNCEEPLYCILNVIFVLLS